MLTLLQQGATEHKCTFRGQSLLHHIVAVDSRWSRTASERRIHAAIMSCEIILSREEDFFEGGDDVDSILESALEPWK